MMKATVDPSIADFIQSLPKTETHLHIEGAVPWELLQETFPGEFESIPEAWAPDFQYKSFTQFEDEVLSYAYRYYTSPERYHESAKRVFQSHLDQNVRYVETSFHLGILERIGGAGPDIVDAIKSAVPEGLEVRLFMGMLRNHYQGDLIPLMDEIHTWEGLDGIDMHGHETIPWAAWAGDLWQRVREAGKFTKSHAGEFEGAKDVNTALDLLGTRRIQHGLGAAYDKATFQRLLDEEIALDMCPVSNVKLRSVENVKKHPIREFFDAGVTVTVSTDDPTVFGNDLVHEYDLLMSHLNFTKKEVIQVARNGFQVALVEDSTRHAWLSELDQIELTL
ncbi:MAG: adenosine deaminase [Verrucomicrobia bacterium]|nr:adenosine deaminase [Verrucomicrobiota bacterium]